MLRTGVGLEGQGREHWSGSGTGQTLRERKRADASGGQPVQPVQRKDKWDFHTPICAGMSRRCPHAEPQRSADNSIHTSAVSTLTQHSECTLTLLGSM